MDTFLTGIMLFLMLLASFNLFVGVSNDAVNFLSSALGSRAASFNRVMFVAAAGVLLGCTFSSGMMEIARSGIFNPTMFTFYDVMIVFFAVMMTTYFSLTPLILLDFQPQPQFPLFSNCSAALSLQLATNFGLQRDL